MSLLKNGCCNMGVRARLRAVEVDGYELAIVAREEAWVTQVGPAVG